MSNFRNLEILTLIAYIIGLIASVVRVRFLGLTILTFTFSDLVDEGYLNEIMIYPLYLAIVAAFIAILTVAKNEKYFRTSAFLSAILPVITLFSLQGAISKLDKDLEMNETLVFVSGSNDLGVFVIIVGIILSLYAALKFNISDVEEKTSPPVQNNVMLASRNHFAKPIYPQHGVTPVQNPQTKTIDVSEKKAYGSKFCSNCGNEVVDGNIFCSSCGVKVED